MMVNITQIRNGAGWFISLLFLAAAIALATPFGFANAASGQRIFLIFAHTGEASRLLSSVEARLIDQPHQLGALRSYLVALPNTSSARALYAAGAVMVLVGQPTGCGASASA